MNSCKRARTFAIIFFIGEYFHGDSGRGVAAFHQTGWTGLIATLLQSRRPESAEGCRHEPAPVRDFVTVQPEEIPC
jgi:hypothetical protein